MDQKLIFVYNANSGKWNGYMDIMHKIISPATYPCSLCAITHGTFKVRQEWVDFKKELSIPMEFLHKDEWENLYQSKHSLPGIFISRNGNIENLISSDLLNSLDLKGLKDMLLVKINSRLK